MKQVYALVKRLCLLDADNKGKAKPISLDDAVHFIVLLTLFFRIWRTGASVFCIHLYSVSTLPRSIIPFIYCIKWFLQLKSFYLID